MTKHLYIYADCRGLEGQKMYDGAHSSFDKIKNLHNNLMDYLVISLVTKEVNFIEIIKVICLNKNLNDKLKGRLS